VLCFACADTVAPSLPQVPALQADAGVDSVHVRFDLGPGSAMSFGSIPWPDDLYLGRGAQVGLADFPEHGVAPEYARALLDGLADLDGFGVSSPIYFFLDGEIDPASLPQTAADSTGDRASVFLIDADTGSPDAFRRVRVEPQWLASTHRLALRPALGHPLVPGRRYAALVTRRVKDLDGRSIEATAKFVAARDSTGMLSDARLMQARAEYTPVLETLTKTGMAREDIVGMAVFRVQSTSHDLDDARAIVRSGKPPIAANLVTLSGDQLDAALGKASGGSALAAAHDQLSALVHGTLASPSFVSATAKTHGPWERDEAGHLRVKRTDDVPFTLFLPRAGASAAGTPIVIYQHQQGHDRSDAVYVANVLAGRGIAVIAIDAPFQGLRAKPSDAAKGVDSRNRFTGAATPDRFGDDPGDFFGIDESSGGLVPLHPFYARDAIRQGVVDLMTVVRFIQDGDFSSISGALQGRKLGAPRFGFIGEDVGGEMGVLLAQFEVNLQALVLFAPGSSVAQDWWLAARDQASFAALAGRLGRDAAKIDYDADGPAFWPGLALFDTLAARGEPLAYAAALKRAAVNVLVLMVDDDEAVSNSASEALAVAVGATFVSGEPRYVGDLATQSAAAGELVSGNFPIEGNHVTRVLQAYAKADHALLLSAVGTQDYAHPPDPPFKRLSAPKRLSNPTGAALAQIAEYFGSFFDCVTAVNPSASAIKCQADARVPSN
jgi:hypothetical protein